MSNNNELPIAIIGAGIGGLTLALSLLKQNKKVRLFEKVSEFAEIGAGLSLAPNCSKVFDRLGVLKKIAELSDTPQNGYITLGDSGERIHNTPFSEIENIFGYPYYQIHRARCHQLLVDEVLAHDPDCIFMNAELKAINETEDQITLEFIQHEEQSVACVIGCDGVRSAVRKLYFDETEPRFTGYVAWRALVPMQNIDAEYQQPVSFVNLLHQRQFVHYPLNLGEYLNIAAFAEQDWQIESWTEPADIEEMHSVYSDFRPSIHTLIDAIDPAHCFKWALYDRDPMDVWSKDRIVLMGDAAHPMLPYLGQGAAMAIEDAWYLAQAVANYDDYATAFAAFQRARKPRTDWVLQESRAAGERFATQTPSAETYADDKAMSTKVMFGFDPITECEQAYASSA